MSNNTPLLPGAPAPGFRLKHTTDQLVGLEEFRGKPVVLMFYPADFSPVCGDELALYNEILPEFDNYHAQVMGVSVDSVWCHQAYAKERSLRFPLLSDFHPKGAVSRLYNSYNEETGASERSLYVIDKDGVIKWSYISPVEINPGADGVLQALEDLDR